MPRTKNKDWDFEKKKKAIELYKKGGNNRK